MADVECVTELVRDEFAVDSEVVERACACSAQCLEGDARDLEMVESGHCCWPLNRSRPHHSTKCTRNSFGGSQGGRSRKFTGESPSIIRKSTSCWATAVVCRWCGCRRRCRRFLGRCVFPVRRNYSGRSRPSSFDVVRSTCRAALPSTTPIPTGMAKSAMRERSGKARSTAAPKRSPATPLTPGNAATAASVKAHSYPTARVSWSAWTPGSGTRRRLAVSARMMIACAPNLGELVHP